MVNESHLSDNTGDPNEVPSIGNTVSTQRSGATAEQQEQYISTIRSHARRTKEQCLYPGTNFKQLVHFLTNPTQVSHVSSPNFACVVVHALSPSASTSIEQFNDITYHSPVCRFPHPAPSSGQISFLRGFLTSDWLKLVGAHYRTDPEFFRRHLDFLQIKRFHDLPSLPSSSRNIIHLRVPHIFLRQAALTPQQFQRARQEEKQRIRNHQRHLANSGSVGDTLIRRLSVLDPTTFILEHNISISITGTNRKGWTALVWLDIGKSLAHAAQRPWDETSSSSRDHGSLQHQSDCLPVFQHRHKIALERLETNSKDRPAGIECGMFQGESILPTTYGKFLHRDAKNSDAIYALSDIFLFAANAESQFMNLIQTHIDEKIATVNEPVESNVHDLQHTKTLLDDHADQICNTLSILRSRGKSKWPRSETHATVVQETIDDITNDYEYLLKRAQLLARRCVDGIETMGSNAQLKEARKAIQEAEQTRRLTLLAFFYLPLTFTTSIFGMNFKELGQGDKSIWLAPITGLIVLLLSSLAYIWHSLPCIAKQRKLRVGKAYMESYQKPQQDV